MSTYRLHHPIRVVPRLLCQKKRGGLLQTRKRCAQRPQQQHEPERQREVSSTRNKEMKRCWCDPIRIARSSFCPR